MAEATFFGLAGANPAATVLENLQTASAAVKATLNATLHAALKSRLTTTLTNANLPALASLIGSMPSADIAASSSLSIQVFLKRQLYPIVAKDPAMQEAVDGEIGNLATADTVGSLLGLDQALRAHPVFGADTVKASIAALLATSPTLGPNQKLQTDFINRYAASNGSVQGFWQPLSNDPNLKSAIPELQLTLGLGMATQNNPALLAAVRAKYKPASVRDLVKLTANDWAQLISSKNIPLPSSVSGATAAEMTANYVAGIMDLLRSAYAGDYIRQGLSQHPLDAIDAGVSQFLKNSPDFDFVKTPVASYLGKSAGALAGIAAADQGKVVQRVKGYQRLARLSPDFEVMSALMANGLDSAYKIASAPRQCFLQQISQALGSSSKAEALYASAKGATASTLNLYQSVREGLGKVHPRVFGNVPDEVSAAVQQIPDWQELFGSSSGCDCQDCKSVLSAAAYLADLLHFLSKANIDPTNPFSATLLTVLSGRRPDLVNLKLDCENTNTTLPYLDLVNEILESVVVSKVGQLPSLPAYNTPADATSDELQVNPEFTKAAAYFPLENTFYPFSLPFDRFFSTARTYLEFFGSSLYEAMKTFQVGIDPAVPANSNPHPTPSDQIIAQEYLRISARESLILTGQPFQGTSPLTNPSELSRYYGYEPGGAARSANIIAAPNGAVRRNNLATITTGAAHGFASGQLVVITGVADGSFDGTFLVTVVRSSTTFTFRQALSDTFSGGGMAAAAPWYVDLAYVPTFLRRTGLAYNDLVGLLETHFLNPSQGISLQVNNAQNGCDIDSAVINGLVPINTDGPDFSALQTIYRFIRLYTKLGWQISELDKAITALGAADIDSPLLCKLSEAKQLQSKWNWTPLATLALWANLDSEGADSFYMSSYQNKGTLNAVDPGLTLRYTAALAAGSTLNLSFLNPYGAQISWKAGQLQFTDSNGNAATMTANQERFLLSLSADTEYQQAIVQLFLQNPAPLASLPPSLVLPTQLPDSIYYQGTQLYFLGEMPDDLRTQLKFSSTDLSYQLAIDNLYEMRWAPGTEVAIATQTLASQAGQLVTAQTIPAHANTISASLRLSAPDLAAIVMHLWGLLPSSQSVATPSALGGALASGTYYVVVSAVDAFGECLCANESPAIAVTGPSGSISVSWTAAPGAVSYNVYYTSADAGAGSENLRITSATTGATIMTTALGGPVSSATPPPSPPFPLNLANLSAVYRYAKLAQALGISAPNLISLIQLIGINPFQPSTQSAPGTVQFACKAQSLLESDFSVVVLEYIYRNIANPAAGLGPQQDALDQLASSIQSALTAQPAESSSATDPAGTFLQVYLARVLAVSDVTEMMGLIAGTFPYVAPLNALPAIGFPPTLSQVAFDPANHRLQFTGPMSQQQEAQLLSLSNDPNYQAAIQGIYQNSGPVWNTVYTSSMSAGALPAVIFPPAIASLIAYTNGNKQLAFTGPMSAGQLGQLSPLSSDPSYQTAINNLFAQSAPAWAATLSQPLNSLPPIAFPGTSTDSLASRLQFAAGNLQVAGALSDADEAALLSLSSDPAYQAAIESLYWQPRQFLVGKLYFLDTQSLITLLTNNSSVSLAEKNGLVLNALLKAIEVVVQIVSDGLKLDAALTRLLLVGGQDSFNNALLQSTMNPNLCAIADFLALLGNGLAASYFPNPGFGGAMLQPVSISPGIDFAWSTSSVPAPGLVSNAFSAKWIGQILGQFTETYTFSIRVLPSSQPAVPLTNPPVILSIRGTELPLTLSPASGTGASLSGSEPTAIEYTGIADLVAGKPTSFELDYPNAAGATLTDLRLSWSSLSVPKTVIPQHRFFAGSSFTLDAPLASYKLLCRIALLLRTFKTTSGDLAYLASNATGFAGVDPADPTQISPFNLNTLPTSPSVYSPALFNQWERLLALFNLRDSLTGGDTGLLEIFGAASAVPPPPVSALIAPIVGATGWNGAEVGLLLGSQVDPLTTGILGFGLSAGDFTDERWLLRLQGCMALAARFGASSKQLFEWAALGESPAGTLTTNGTAVTWISGANFSSAWAWAIIYINGVAYSIQSASSTSLTLASSAGVQASAVPYYVTGFVSLFEASVARDIQAAVKAQYSDATWVKVGNSLNDKLRESSRDALVAYILSNATNWELTIENAPVVTADDLYEYFLIDVQMGSCMQTSRVVQAAATVQLFVQRCLMNLEPQVPPSTIDTTTWSWMQNYRVWQANREVFLFPENYMDPTLRDDKTPFFREMETELQQNPLTPAAAEQALMNYLEKLDQVARLDIRSMYWNDDQNSQSAPDGTADSSNDVLHVFGRTPSTPNVYYYRRLLKAGQCGQPNSPTHWTAWEKINVDIQGDQLVPVVWDGRLYVFWPIFTESSDPTQPPPPSSAPPQKILKIQMAWSRYSQGGWSAKQVSTDSLVPQFYLTSLNKFSSQYTGALAQSLFLFSSDKTSGGDLAIRVWTPKWGSQYYGPGNAIPGQGAAPLAQTQAVFEGSFQFTGCSSDGTVSYTDPVYNWNQNSPVALGGNFPSNCEYDAGTIDLIQGAEKLSVGAVDFLTQTPSPFRLAQSDPAQQFLYGTEFFLPDQPFAYQDAARTYFVNPMGVFYQYVFTSYFTSMQFKTFWHPHACAFIKTLNQYGIASLMSLLTQQRTNDGGVVSGLALSASGTLTPGLTPGTLFAQGRFYQAVLPPSVPAAPASSTQQLFCGPSGNFYYSPQKTMTPGDALIGSVVSNATSIVKVVQGAAVPQPTIFAGTYGPNPGGWAEMYGGFVPYFSTPFPQENVDFSFDGAYSIYNWELFFHIPLLMATLFGQDQQFEEAQKWFHYIFNPTTNSNDSEPQRFWNFLPFHECSASDEILGPIERLLEQQNNAGLLGFQGSLYTFSTQVSRVTGPKFDSTWVGATIHIPIFGGEITFTVVSVLSSTSLTVSQPYWVGDYQYYVTFSPGMSECGQEVQSQVAAWQAEPFAPFLLGRLRTIAFRKMVVMKYIDNLIAWGDFQFAQNTRESINEATQLYVLAQQILGDKPSTMPLAGVIPEYSYNGLLAQASTQGLSGLDDFSNVLVALENAFPFGSNASPWLGNSGTEPVSSVAASSYYFCIPQNDQLLGCWDTVADRLYKLRHCMNLSGQVEQLALFAPPINPALLVQAAAAGMDLSSVLNDINAPSANYRFSFILQKALELCAEVRSLGAALLSALEKSDAEGLSALRTGQEVSLLQAVLQIKQSQIDEANKNVAGLQASYAVAQYRQQYYQSLLAAGLSTFEQNQVSSLMDAQSFQSQSQTYEIASGLAAMLPNLTVGSSGEMGSPVATATFGGIDLQAILSAQSRALAALASFSTYSANMMGLTGGWDRRAQEWSFQQQFASRDLAQIQSQIDAATVRVQIAQSDLQNQQLQITNAQAVLDFLNNKYTNQELYSWMIAQISAVYFRCYQMAYGLAKRAESCYRFELGLASSSFIQFGYWDSRRKGLLAGESLYCDLKRMELAYLDQNQREFEITKYISLVLFDPLALITLKQTGQCVVSLPEALLDMDYPGHYMRRLKSVSLTIPCVAGPYTSINCKLTLVSSQIRIDNVANSPQDYTQGSHFVTNLAATQSIATSSAQSDSGMFELNFRDERYLPFEGAGVISQWLIELPQDCNAFDFETISDVVINLKYTARDGGQALSAAAKQAAVLPGPAAQAPAGQTVVPFSSQINLARFFSLRHEFPSEWYRFLNPLGADTVQTMMLALTRERFPFQYRGRKISVSQVDLLLKFKNLNDTQRFKTGTPLGDFGATGLLNIYLTPAATAPGQQPQAPTQPPPNANPIGLKSASVNFNGAPYGTGPVLTGVGLLWLQVFTTGNYIGRIAPTLLDGNNHLLADNIEDIFMVCHYSVG